MDSRDFKEKQDGFRRIAIGSDHGGWELKEHLKDFLRAQGFHVEDFGLPTPERTDYPAIGIRVARSVSEGSIGRGILICGTGIGMSIIANKFPGVRAALCHDIYTARMSREHNNANILVLGGRILGKGLSEEIVKTWLYSEFSESEGRHLRRLCQISDLEKELGLG